MRARTRVSLFLSMSLLVATLSGCTGSPGAPTAALRDEFVLAPGATSTLSDGSARITFTGVTGDSRCPADAMCIQGGDAVVHIEVAGSSGRRTHELHTGSMAPVTHDGLTITLVQLMPYPFSSRPFPPDEYRATLLVTRPGR